MQQPPNNWGQPPQGGFQGQQPQQQAGFGQPPGQGGWGQQPQPGGYPAQPGGYPGQPGANPYQAPMPNAYGGYGSTAPVQMDIKQILFSFEGRASRTHYWLAYLGTVVTVGIFAGVAVAALDELGAMVALVAYIPALWVMLAVSVKRWHDRGKSGFMVLIGLIPIIGPLWTLVECGILEGDPGPNQFGPPVA